jgi:short-subunit dehydrogenase
MRERFTMVTGASAGIGREIASVAAESGRNLAIVARRKDRLLALARDLTDRHGVRVEVFSCDLTAEEAPARLHREALARNLEVDELVNNAGFGSLGTFHEAALDEQLDMLNLNVLALTHLSRLFLPAMVDAGRGRILNLASTAAFQPGPLMAVYYASKAYVLSLSEALAEELRGTGVTVTVLCPGATRTEFQSRARTEGSRFMRMGMADARTVAEIGFRAMVAGHAVAVPGVLNRLLVFAVRLSPRFLVRRIVRELNRPR